VADGERTGEERLSARVIELEAELLAKTKTIDVLMTRVEGSLASRSSSFAIFEQNITLEAVVAARTRELREQGEVLTRALDELRRMQVQLVQAQKLEAIGTLAAREAHEINTPVQYVSDNVTFLSRAFVQIVAVAKAAGVLLGAAEPELPRLELERALKKAKLDFLLTQVPRALEQSRDGLTRIATIVGAMKEFSHPRRRSWWISRTSSRRPSPWRATSGGTWPSWRRASIRPCRRCRSCATTSVR
jgi:signal transduction histidine kinase